MAIKEFITNIVSLISDFVTATYPYMCCWLFHYGSDSYDVG
jgi:hypothetical protein